MKNCLLFSLLLAAGTLPQWSFAQGEDCNTATPLSDVSSWCSEPGAFSNVGSNDSGFSPGCFPNAQPNLDVWFSFVAEATDVNISVAGATGQSNGGTLVQPQFALYSGSCGALTEIGCFSDALGDNGGQLFASMLTIGQTYYIQVGARGGNSGTFQLCVNNFNAIPNPSSDCATGVILCDKSPFTVEQVTGVGNNGNEIDDVSCGTITCPLSESGSAWYKWTCDEPGSLTFSLNPLNPADDLDFVLYELPNGIDDCSGKFDLRCMASGEVVGADFEVWEPCTGATGLATGETDVGETCGCDTGDNNFIAPIDMEAGKSYALVVNNFSQSGSGFTVEFGGTGTFLGPEAEFSTNAPNDTVCLEASVLFTDESSFVGGISSWTWNFGEGASPETITGQGPHAIDYDTPGLKNIVLRVSTPDGCVITHIETIFVQCCEGDFTVDADISNLLCPGDTNGSIALAPSNDNPPYTFIWGTGATASSIGSLAAGDYTVTITDDFTCDTVLTYTVMSPDTFDIDTLLTMPTCNGGTDGGINLQVSGGTPPYTFSWENGPFTNDNTYTGLAVGDYPVTIRDANGCEADLVIPVRELELQLTSLEESIVDPSCTGFSDGAITIDIANGQPPYQYDFNDGGGFANSNVRTGLTAGTYIVDAVDANGCVGQFVLTLNDPPPLEISFGLLGISCFGEADAVLTAVGTGGTGSYSYRWEDNSTGAVRNNLGEGVYAVTITDANGCTVAGDTAILQPPLLELEVASLQNVVCFGDTTGLILLQGTGGTPPYEYSIGGNSFQVAPLFENLGAGAYSLSIMDANGCLAALDTLITQPPQLTVDAGQDIRISLGYSDDINAVSSNPDVAYNWMPPDSLSCTDCPRPVANPVNTTTYTIEVMDENGCTALDSVTVRVIKNRPVYIPDAFSPNDDGSNDFFTAYAGPGVRQIRAMKIFNRWGGLVFEGGNFQPNEPARGWDGLIGDEPAAIGVYAWLIEVEFIDGVAILFEGDLHLIR